MHLKVPLNTKCKDSNFSFSVTLFFFHFPHPHFLLAGLQAMVSNIEASFMVAAFIFLFNDDCVLKTVF